MPDQGMIYKLILKVLKINNEAQTGLRTDAIQLRHKRTNTKIFWLNESKSPGKKLNLRQFTLNLNVKRQDSKFNFQASIWNDSSICSLPILCLPLIGEFLLFFSLEIT